MPIILGTIVVVAVAGVLVFFWWRSQYGVWAEDRERRREGGDASAPATVVAWDGGSTSGAGAAHGTSAKPHADAHDSAPSDASSASDSVGSDGGAGGDGGGGGGGD